MFVAFTPWTTCALFDFQKDTKQWIEMMYTKYQKDNREKLTNIFNKSRIIWIENYRKYLFCQWPIQKWGAENRPSSYFICI